MENRCPSDVVMNTLCIMCYVTNKLRTGGFRSAVRRKYRTDIGISNIVDNISHTIIIFSCQDDLTIVSLVKTRQMNYNLTLKGHVENLTSGQGHDLIRNGHAAYQSFHCVSLNTSMVFSSLKLVSIKSYLICIWDC